jgi:hypothetical protein
MIKPSKLTYLFEDTPDPLVKRLWVQGKVVWAGDATYCGPAEEPMFLGEVHINRLMIQDWTRLHSRTITPPRDWRDEAVAS